MAELKKQEKAAERSEREGRPADKISVYDYQLAGPAADLIATVISLFNSNRKPEAAKKLKRHDRLGSLAQFKPSDLLAVREGDGEESRGRSMSTLTFSNVNVRVLPIRSLRNAIHALQQVVRSSPMFPKTA